MWPSFVQTVLKLPLTYIYFPLFKKQKNFLKEWIIREHQNDLDCGFDSTYYIDNNGEYGRIEVHYPDHVNVTEAKIGLVQD